MESRFGGAQALCGGGLAVGLSGGPDSMALCFLLSRWLAERSHADGFFVHALTVDHGLRPESAAEARQARAWIADWPRTVHKTLRWNHGGGRSVRTRIQEAARAARYDLMRGYMRRHKIGALFLAHHRDDQAETMLFRLAHGSGLDGLCGMAARQDFGGGLTLCRPLLDFSKADLIATCVRHGLNYHIDPSNRSETFARARMRGSMAVLAREGMTAERLSVTAGRLARARTALDELADRALMDAIVENNPNRVVLSYSVFQNVPDEVGLRVLMRVMDRLVPPDPYRPRLERVEALFSDLMKPERFRKRTLNGTVFERKDKAGLVILSLEGGAAEGKLQKTRKIGVARRKK